MSHTITTFQSPLKHLLYGTNTRLFLLAPVLFHRTQKTTRAIFKFHFTDFFIKCFEIYRCGSFFMICPHRYNDNQRLYLCLSATDAVYHRPCSLSDTEYHTAYLTASLLNFRHSIWPPEFRSNSSTNAGCCQSLFTLLKITFYSVENLRLPLS